ncbi:MAG: enoyl-CoA hydratase/isomerase family protein [Ilumatobacteraceae bacterium]
MSVRYLTLPEFCAEVGTAAARGDLSVAMGTSAVVVDLVRVRHAGLAPAEFGQAVRSLPVPIIARRVEPHDVGTEPYADGCDVVIGADDEAGLEAVLDGIRESPLAATALALLLRGSTERDVESGVVAESTTYSMLQAGPEFAVWRSERGVRARPPEIGPAVLVERDDAVLDIRLARPHVHNAVNSRLRAALADAFELAASDPALRTVRVSGVGDSFCSGGDLDEFGSFPDPAASHAIRLTRHPALLAHGLRHRLEFRLHGAALGAGIEIAAFGARVIADPEVSIGLPELPSG